MNLENEERSSLDMDKAHETSHQAQRKSKISYSREFLLSLSELEICKKLPPTFDASLLGEFEDTSSNNTQDRQRIPGTLPFQSYRRNDYSSSPPTRGDSSSYSRNTYGRWDNRSSGRSDRDSDSQSERDSDSGQRGGNISSRKSWQSTSEHDGLLGSGSFPRPSVYASGTHASKAKADEQTNITKTNEPYHPPRPYKAPVPHLRRDGKDSLNDETFGSSDSTSQDRAEEERRRRDAFESMRKEQQKALQEKQILNLDKPKVDSVSDIFALMDDTKEEKRPFKGSDDTPVVSQTIASRPLVPPGFVPPGFANTGLKSVMNTQKSEVVKVDLEEPKGIHNGGLDNLGRLSLQDTIFNNHPLEDKTMRAPLSFPLMEDHLRNSSLLSETHQYLGDTQVINQNRSPLILEKIFDSALNVGSSTGGPIEQVDNKSGDTWGTHNTVQSSKFAQWFSEEERKPGEDSLLYDKPNDLLSLIVGGDKGKSIESSGLAMQFMSKERDDSTSSIIKTDPTPKILTCEDLEQTILSEYGPPQQGNSSGRFMDQNTLGQQPRVEVDNHASKQLLSLLTKGGGGGSSSLNQMGGLSSNYVEVDSKTNIHEELPIPIPIIPREDTSDKKLTLETLFGSAFMSELQSFEAPVSAQRSNDNVDNNIGSGSGSKEDEFEVMGEDERSSLFGISDPPLKSMFMPPGSGSGSGSSSVPMNIGFPKEGRYEGLPFVRGNVPYDNSRIQGPSSSQQMSHHGRPLFYSPMESQQMKFMGPGPPENMFPPPTNMNMIRPHFPRPYDHHQQQIPVMHHPFHEIQRNNSFPHLPPMEVNQMQGGFPLGPPRQPNIPNLGGMPMPGIDNQSEAFQRLLEMELRAKSKQQQQQQHALSRGNSQGMYGQDLDMGFRYR